MTEYVALLRAVNVGGTGRLPMADLTRLCKAAGFTQVRTVGASGNVVFLHNAAEQDVKAALELQLRSYAGKNIGVVVRSASEIAGVLARNPFPEASGNRVMALFIDGSLPRDPLDGVRGLKDERIIVGQRELFVLYPNGMAATRLNIPSEKQGTARNMNTIARLAELCAS